MNIETYLRRREELKRFEPKTRVLCLACRQPDFTCYCSEIRRFHPRMRFVILIHPIEVKRRIATGRMSYLTLENAHLIQGENFSDDREVNSLIEDPALYPVVLYPGKKSVDITKLTLNDRADLFPKNRELTVFVIDGTWNTARKMMHVSENLKALPQICFSLEQASRFRVRKQPREGCFSTIEAIHQMIELVGPTQGFETRARKHDALIRVFDAMVEQQLEYVKLNLGRPPGSTYRRVRPCTP